MSLKLEEMKFRCVEENTAFSLDFERESVVVFSGGRIVVEISFQDIDSLQEQIDNNK